MKIKFKALINATSGILQLPAVAFFLFKNVRTQKKFIKKHLVGELKPFRVTSDNSLSKEDFIKITHYYGLGVPAILGSTFCRLHNKKFEKQERIVMTYLGGISGLLDDLFDDPEREWNHLEEFILAPGKLEPKNNLEAILKQLYLKGLESSENSDTLKKQALLVFITEKQSLQQQSSIAPSKIKELTFLKGGHSFIYYRLCLNAPLLGPERKMIYQFGGLMQMGNDIFDVWEDCQQGIHTLATIEKDIKHLRRCFNMELDLALNYTYACEFKEKQIEQFLKLTLFGLCRVFVCLDQLEKLQNTTNGIFEPHSYSRKQLICDMQRSENKKAALKYYLKLLSEII
tara:strand:+ start:10541 stop:11569 length:1029 start_codon:yes stop_codon:yes gene_type:complete